MSKVDADIVETVRSRLLQGYKNCECRGCQYEFWETLLASRETVAKRHRGTVEMTRRGPIDG